jgi:S1-C subfamily serine protease
MKGMMLAMMQDDAEPKVLAPAAQWGLLAHKNDKDEEAGVVLKEVLGGSPAAAAGLKPGDRLLTLDGRWTDSLVDLYTAAGHVKAGTAVKVTVRRDGKEVELEVKPAAGL